MSQANEEGLDLFERLTARGASRSALHYVATVVKTLESNALFCNSAATQLTASQAMLWLDTVLRQRALTGEPRAHHLDNALGLAKQSLGDLQGIGLTVARRWSNRLPSKIQPATYSILIAGEWQQHALETCSTALATPSLTDAATQRLAHETAAALHRRGRASSRIKVELSQALDARANRFRSLHEVISEVMWQPDREHRVMVGLKGIASLASLSASMVGANISVLLPDQIRPYKRWGRAGGAAADHVKYMANQRAQSRNIYSGVFPDVLLDVSIQAVDPTAAIWAANTLVDGMLDEYLAGHPSIDISIHPIVAVARPDSAGSFEVMEYRQDQVIEATPLVAQWPSQQRIALRVAALARSNSQDMTRAALSWVTVESAGVRLEQHVDEVPLLARALALHALRQQMISQYREVIAASGELGARIDRRRKQAKNLVRRAKKLIRNAHLAPRGASLAHRAVHDLLRALSILQQSNIDAAIAANRQPWLDSLRVSPPGSVFGEPRFARLHDFDRWATHLRQHHDFAARGATPSALSNLHGILPEDAQASTNRLAEMCSNSPVALNWLKGHAEFYEYNLRALNTARNMNLHAGVYDAPGAELLSRLGPLVIDAYFEILSAWYSRLISLPARAVLLTLNDRFEETTSNLATGATLEELDLARITGPNWRT